MLSQGVRVVRYQTVWDSPHLCLRFSPSLSHLKPEPTPSTAHGVGRFAPHQKLRFAGSALTRLLFPFLGTVTQAHWRDGAGTRRVWCLMAQNDEVVARTATKAGDESPGFPHQCWREDFRNRHPGTRVLDQHRGSQGDLHFQFPYSLDGDIL